MRLGIEELAAFRQLRQAFQEAPVLHHFNPDKPITLETDASNFAIAAVVRDHFSKVLSSQGSTSAQAEQSQLSYRD